MNATIKELFYGNINPNERSISSDSELKQSFRDSVEASEKLMSEWNDHHKELFDKYMN